MRDFAVDNPHVNVAHAALLQRARPRHHHAAGQGARAAGRCRRCSASTRASSSCTRPTWCGRSCSCSRARVQGIYNVAGDGLLPWSEVAAICGKRTDPAAARSGSGLLSAPLTRLGPRPAARAARPAAPRPRRRQPPPQAGRASTTATRRPAPSPTSSRRCASARWSASSETAYQYERDVEQFFRHSPAVVRDDVDGAERRATRRLSSPFVDQCQGSDGRL